MSGKALHSVGRSLTRRSVMRASLGATLAARFKSAAAQSVPLVFGYPVGQLGRVFGDGFLDRHGYATENTWYLPGYLHAGEDWYTTEGDAAGAGVYAAAAGEVVFAGSNYPGRVVIVQHADDLFSMYGHLDYALAVAEGDGVERGQRLGAILTRTDSRAPSHLHFEMRTFFTTPEVNGESPRYGFGCGFECPPGPGFWPIGAPEHPSAMGWRNPTHVIGGHTELLDGSEAVVAMTATGEVDVWSAPQPDDDAELLRNLPMRPGDRFALLAIDAGLESSEGTSAEAYRLWYRLATTDGTAGWVQAAVPSANDTGSDGRPSSVRFQFLPATLVD
jgi:murein DD-endopeptidase MepM/ murein hydrolase activator NlpD